MAYKKWIIGHADKEKASQISEKLNIDPFISYLLAVRGFDDELGVSDFLSDSARFISPFSLIDMDKAAERVNRAVQTGEKICIYGDYDCDGVTATALLYSYLESEGADVIYYIPDRFTDGYGLNKGAVDKTKELETDLIITVDNGISAVEEAEYIYSLGMELVVTDHHQPGDVLPSAEAVVDPHRTDNDIPFRDFAGVGVAFKLVCALYGGEVDELLEQYADLVTIGTIGDTMPLVNENRSIVKIGLKEINSSSRLGISKLVSRAGMNPGEISADDIAFRICPRINAAGRMDKALLALELLLSDDDEDAQVRTERLCNDNEYRHTVENNINESIRDEIALNPELVYDRVIVVDGKNYHKGVIGISAARLTEEYSKPAVVISVDDDGNATGSARSIEGFNMYKAVASCSDLLSHFGGHSLAAGLGLKANDIELFRKRINAYAAEHYSVMPVPALHIDCE
ncbi:MAG: single-stranded-DNA-specific exonuclease RecJ, partial [Clostridiales bacterium]|nr:single-stranded-DNA-specific exonuclease RecJ [Clostridiales bacterium]